MDIFFADDSNQATPSWKESPRNLVAVGGLLVAAEEVGALNRDLAALCEQFGFPRGDPGEFKWSPGRNLWMRRELTGAERTAFYTDALKLANDRGCSAIIIITHRAATVVPPTCKSVEEMTVTLLLERIDGDLGQRRRDGLLVADRPGGGRKDEDSFIAGCAEQITQGTRFANLSTIAHPPLTTASKLSRCLQLADVVTGCTLACFAGDEEYAEPLFRAAILPLIQEGPNGRRGGYGVKCHPDFVFGNLYHWLLGDTEIPVNGVQMRLPDPGRRFSSDPRRK